MVKYLLALFLMVNGGWLLAQTDTLTYKDVTIEMTANQVKTIFYKQQKFNGILKSQKEDESYCYEYIRKGKLLRTKCDRAIKVKEPKQRFAFNLSQFSVLKSIPKESLSITLVKAKYNPCAQCDSMIYVTKRYSINDKAYSGYAKNSDTIFFMYEGELKFIKTMYPSGKESDYTEIERDQKEGQYWKKKENGKLLAEGKYKANHKVGKWTFYDKDGYDIIVEDYLSDQKFGIWYYYKGKNVVKSEFYEQGMLDYYYTSVFNKDIEVRSYYKNGKKTSVSTYKDGHLDYFEKITE